VKFWRRTVSAKSKKKKKGKNQRIHIQQALVFLLGICLNFLYIYNDLTLTNHVTLPMLCCPTDEIHLVRMMLRIQNIRPTFKK